MLLFQKRFHDGLKDGSITLTFRYWTQARVKPGGRYRCHPIGVLEVDAVSQVKLEEVSEDDARRAGFPSRDALLEYLASSPQASPNPQTEVYRVELHYGGDGDRVPIALEDQLTAADVETLRKKLERLDRNQRWTLETLELIEAHPQVAARILAKKLGRDRDEFKVDVRKLKRLGLTQSFEVGYEVSPRGRAYLRAVRGGA